MKLPFRILTSIAVVAIISTQLLNPLLRADDEKKIEPGKRGVIRFSESPIQSSDKEQVALRLSASETPPDFDITQEEFEILVPEDYDAKQPHGLFIWIRIFSWQLLTFGWGGKENYCQKNDQPRRCKT